MPVFLSESSAILQLTVVIFSVLFLLLLRMMTTIKMVDFGRRGDFDLDYID